MRQRSQTIGALGRAPARQSLTPFDPDPPDAPRQGARGRLRQWIHGALFDNMGLKFLSLVLALTVALLVNSDHEREITVQVPVKYEIPSDRVLVSDRLVEARVTIKGPWRRLRQFDERELDRIELDLRDSVAGEVELTPALIADLPVGLKVTSITPRTVRVAFDKKLEKLVEVAPMVTGRPQHGHVTAEVNAIPATVTIRGGERLLGALTAIRTSEVNLDGHTRDFEQEVSLVAPAGVTVDEATSVRVLVRIREELVATRIPDVPVKLLAEGGDPARWTVSPANVEVTLTGARLEVEAAAAAMTARANVSVLDPRAREIKIVIDGVEPGIGVRVVPDRVRVAPARAAAPNQPK